MRIFINFSKVSSIVIFHSKNFWNFCQNKLREKKRKKFLEFHTHTHTRQEYVPRWRAREANVYIYILVLTEADFHQFENFFKCVPGWRAREQRAF